MNIPVSLESFIGNSHSVEILKRALEQDRLPHAMIFAGPPGVGKTTLALLMAQRLNCLSPVSNTACGHCSACRRILAVLESRNLACKTLKGGFCGTCPNCQLRTKRHPDVRLIEPDEKSIITIDQVRDLIDEIAFQPAEAHYRVVIFDPAGEMQAAAQNSLLKTLEEPASRTILILITTNPYSLLQTIRSRSRMLQFGPISHEAIERYLAANTRMPAEEARLAAAISGGSLGTALGIDTTEYRDVRTQALQFVNLLLKRGRFVEVSNIALQVTKEKDKELFQLWIETVAALLQDVYFCGVAPERVAQHDVLDKLSELARSSSRDGLVRAVHAVEKLKRDLQHNVNRQLAVEAMFIALGSRA